MKLKRELAALYAEEGVMPEEHLADIKRQVEKQTSHYETKTEKVEVSLAVVKPEG
jgi:hypothetical protein